MLDDNPVAESQEGPSYQVHRIQCAIE